MDGNSYSEIVHGLYNLSANGVQPEDVRFQQLLSALSNARELRGPLNEVFCDTDSSSNNPVTKAQFDRLLEQIDVISKYLSLGSEVPNDVLKRCGVEVTSPTLAIEKKKPSIRDEILYYAEVLHGTGDRWGSNLGWVEYSEVLSENTLSYSIKAVRSLRSLLQFVVTKSVNDSVERIEMHIREFGLENFAKGFRIGGKLHVDNFLGGLDRLERQLRLLTLQRNFKRTLRFVRHLYLSEPSSADTWSVRPPPRKWSDHVADFMNRNNEAVTIRSNIASSVCKRIQKQRKNDDVHDIMQSRGRLLELQANDPMAAQRHIYGMRDKRLHLLCTSCETYMRSLLNVSVSYPATTDNSSEHPLYRSREIVYMLPNLIIENVRHPPHSLSAGDVFCEHHREGLSWLLSMYNSNLNGVLADDFKFDRILHVISLLCYLNDIKAIRGPHLIVLPLASMQGNWISAFEDWYPGCRTYVYEGGDERRRSIRNNWTDAMFENPSFDVMFVTDLILGMDHVFFKRIKWEYAIVDGMAALNHPRGYVLHALNSGFSIRRRLLLTTEPLQYNVPEMWSAVNFLFPEMYNTPDDFISWLQEPFVQLISQEDLQAIQLTEEEAPLVIEIFANVLAPFVKRRTVESCPSIVPMYNEHMVYCPMSGVQTKLYNFLKKAHLDYDKTLLFQDVCNHPYTFCPETFLCDETVITTSGKFVMLDICLSRLIPAKHRVLIISPSDSIMHLMEAFLNLRSFKYIRVDETDHPEDYTMKMNLYNMNMDGISVILATKASCVNMMLVDTDTLICFEGGITADYVTVNNILKDKDALLLRLVVPTVTSDPYLNTYEVYIPKIKDRSNPGNIISGRPDLVPGRPHSIAYLDRLLTRSTIDEQQFYMSSMNRCLSQNVILIDETVLPPCLVKSIVHSSKFRVEDLQKLRSDERQWYNAIDTYDMWAATPSDTVLIRSHMILNPDSVATRCNNITGMPLGYPIDRVTTFRGVLNSLWMVPGETMPHQRMILINDVIKKALDLAMKSADFVIFTQAYLMELYGDFLNHLPTPPVTLDEIFSLAEAIAFPSLGGLNTYLERLCSNVRSCHGVRSPVFFKALNCFNAINSCILHQIPYSFVSLSDSKGATDLQLLYEELKHLY